MAPSSGLSKGECLVKDRSGAPVHLTTSPADCFVVSVASATSSAHTTQVAQPTDKAAMSWQAADDHNDVGGDSDDALTLLSQPLLSDVEAAATSPYATAEPTPLLVEPPLPEADNPSVRNEAYQLASLALPMMLQGIASMLIMFISTSFVGHMNDPLALSAVVLSSSIYTVSGVSMTYGLASAMDTFCGQAFGARDYAVLGEVLQRARAICWTVCIPVAILWWNIEPVLLLVGQEVQLARLAAINMRILTPGLFLGVLSDTTRRYLDSQRVVAPTSFCYLLTTAMSPLYNYVFIFRLDLRTAGAAIATTCSTATVASLLLAYQLYRDKVVQAGKSESTWHGYSLAAFRGWWQYLGLGVPAAAMICLEWWVWELMVFMAGTLPDASTAVGVMGLCIQITNPSYMIPGSFGSATSIRVSNFLGAGLPRKARTTTRVSACIVLAGTMVMAVATYLARDWVVRIFTEDMHIRSATAAVLPAVAASIVGDGMVGVLSAVLRASGRQTTGAVMHVAGYWGLCVPLAGLLGVHCKLGVLGFWLALSISTALQAGAFGILIGRFDWQREVQRAAALLRKARQES